MRTDRMLPLLFLCAGLAACQQEATITVEQAAGNARFVLSRPAGKQACIQDLSVYEGKPEGKPPLWHIASAGDAPCTTTVTFAAVPQGFAQDDGTPALKLVPGRSYSVQASGTGWMAFDAFTAR